MDLGAPRQIEAKRRKSLILKDFPRIAAAGFSAEDKDHVSNRSMLSSIRGNAAPSCNRSLEKRASDNAEAEELARSYALYKVAALQRIAVSDIDFPLTARLSVRQNHVV